jgi:hypothetical protein
MWLSMLSTSASSKWEPCVVTECPVATDVRQDSDRAPGFGLGICSVLSVLMQEKRTYCGLSRRIALDRVVAAEACEAGRARFPDGRGAKKGQRGPVGSATSGT